jgi:hypothetical protein
LADGEGDYLRLPEILRECMKDYAFLAAQETSLAASIKITLHCSGRPSTLCG